MNEQSPTFSSPRLPLSLLRAAGNGRLAGVTFIGVLALFAGCHVQSSSSSSPATPPPGKTRPSGVEAVVQAATLSGFSDQVVFSGLTNPVAVRFASTGKVFVAEENGRIYFFDNMSDATPTLFADLRGDVNSYWDRGLLGFTIDPNYATNGHVYALYAHDQATNAENNQSVANRNGTDNCPSPPGGTSNGCVTYGRLVRITDPGSGYPITSRTVLVDEWPQQFPSHSVGGLAFGPDGFLYATGGDGASFGAQDWGQYGIPVNPLGDPPGGVGGSMTSPTSRGGSLRSQSFRRPTGENVTLNGALIRIDPATGAGATGNPNLGHADLDAQRLIAFGLRNPYRFTFHPTTGDIWIGDVGGNAYEEIDRLPAPLTGTPVKNFGWPCFEGPSTSSNWSGFDLCSGVTHTAPYYSYAHDVAMYTGDACATGGSAITGLAFYPPSGEGNYPTSYRGALFFSDLPRDCIMVVFPGADGLPNTGSRTNFIVSASNPVDLQIGPNNDLFYVDYGGGGGTGTNAGTGTIRRIRYASPTAIATAQPTSGFIPLTVAFDGSTSTPGLTGDTLTYAWDLDGDGAFDDSTAPQPTHTYNVAGNVVVRLRVTDQRGGFGDSQPLTIVVGSTTEPPQPVIDTPVVGLTWKVGDSISFSGHATDPEDGTIPASGLLWELIMQHCPSACHEHPVQSFDGVASGSFPAPDHEYPSYMQLRLTATDSHGVRTTVTRDLMPRTVELTLAASPVLSPGLTLGINLDTSAPSPYTKTVILGSTNTLIAPDQTRGGTLYSFQSWSNGGPATQTVVANASATYTASFTTSTSPWISQDIGAVAATGTWSETGGVHTIEGSGADIWGAADEFRFTHRSIQGDVTITARVTSLENTNTWAKAGVMIRESTAPGARSIITLVSPTAINQHRMQVRATTDGSYTSVKSNVDSAIPVYLRVQRAGDLFTSSYSTDGTTWNVIGSATVAMPSTALVGLAVTSHADGTLATGVFDNVVFTIPAPPTPPLAPTGLAATAGDGQVALSWTASADAISYTVKRSTTPGGPYTNVQTGFSGTSFTNTGLSNGTTYHYVVSASNGGGESGNSNEASATPQPPPPPPVPAGVQAVAGDAQVTVSWSPSSGATSYSVKRSTTSGGPYITVATQAGTTFTNTAVMNGTTYYYVVSASSSGGESANSAEVSATPAVPPPPATPTNLQATAGNAQVTLSWTGSSGATSYTAKRATTAGGPYATLAAGLGGTSFTDSSATNGTTYYYVVSASNSGGESADSNEASASPAAPPPSAWSSQDIGAVGATGTFSENAGVYTIEGAGADIYGTADAFRFTYQQVTGDARITARVTALEHTHDFSKAGVMFRNSLDAGSRNVHMLASPVASSLMRFIRRTADGGSSTTTTGGQSTLPHWVRVDRIGNTFHGYTSSDGQTFTLVGSETITMNATLYVGMAVTSHVAGTLATAGFDNVTFGTAELPPPPAPTGLQAAAGSGLVGLSWNAVSGASSYTVKRATASGGPYSNVATGVTSTSFTNTGLTNGTTYYFVVSASNGAGEGPNSTQVSATPVDWSSASIGAVAAVGNYSVTGGSYTVNGSGADIYGSADEFHFVYRSISGNATITGRVASIQNTNTWAKAGIMIRNGTSAGAQNVFMLVSPTDSNGYRWQRRTSSGGKTSSTSVGAGTRPVWFRIVRNSSTLTGYHSANGITWTTAGSVTISMATTVQIGMAVTSHADGTLAAGVFDNVTITTP